jgi:signal transduction histidine kinase
MQEVRWGSDPERVQWTICRGAPMRSDAGELIGYAGTIEDVTERKLAEMTLRKTEKLAAMGRLAGAIAHEINNPLEALSNLFFLLQQHPSLDDTAREYANLADQQLARIATITKQSLSFYRESNKATTISVAEIVGEVLDFYRELAHRQNIAVERRFETDGMIIAHAGELRQVFANVVGNALQAMPTGGRLRIHIFPAVQHESGMRTGLRVNVIDTGAGIAPEIGARLFEPFFTTKAEKGTGLGLWVSRGIVEKYEGTIRFRSTRRPKSSTCFSVFLPTVIQQTRRPVEKAKPAERVSAQKA